MKTSSLAGIPSETGNCRKENHMDPRELNAYFFSLISMFASAGWQQLGKIPDRISGEKNTDLKGAQSTIETLLMLRDKTQGNLSGTEEKLLNDTIATLQSNYAEETAKDNKSPG